MKVRVEDSPDRHKLRPQVRESARNASLPPLEEVAERFWLDRGFRQAIAEIESRAQGASPGQLSIAGTEAAGQLSLAPETGQLSLAPAEPEKV